MKEPKTPKHGTVVSTDVMHTVYDTTKRKSNRKREPAQAGFFNTWDKLIEYFKESHEPEMNAKHSGDARHDGPAPEVCTYCEVIQDAENLGELACIPVGKQIECRGRNGYFWLSGVGLYNTKGKVGEEEDADIVVIGFSSKTNYHDAPPVMIQGKHDAIERLLLYLLFEVGRERDKL